MNWQQDYLHRRFRIGFCIDQGGSEPPPAWQRHQLGSWEICHSPDLPITPIETPSSDIQGWVLGHFHPDQSQTLTPERVTWASFSPSHIEHMLQTWSGRYLVIAQTDQGEVFLWPDAAASLAVCYDQEQGRVASIPSLWPDLQERPLQSSSFLESWRVVQNRTNQICPLGYSPYRGIHLLLANHRLSLKTMQPERIPFPEHFGKFQKFRPRDPRIKATVNALQSFYTAARHHSPLAANLTAGRDTRVILAMLLDQCEDVLFQLDAPSDGSKNYDKRQAQLLAQRYSLDLKVGEEGASRQHLLLTGFIGEVGTAFHYKWEDFILPVPESVVLDRFGFRGLTPSIQRLFLDYYRTLPAHLGLLRLDIAYLEQRVSTLFNLITLEIDEAWKFTMYGLSRRDLFFQWLSFPPQWRYRNELILELIRWEHPDLLQLPITEHSISSWSHIRQGLGRLRRRCCSP